MPHILAEGRQQRWIETPPRLDKSGYAAHCRTICRRIIRHSPRATQNRFAIARFCPPDKRFPPRVASANAQASGAGRFETETLALPENREALFDLNGQWFDRFHDRNGLKYIVLDMDSSVSPTHGDQEGAAWNGC